MNASEETTKQTFAIILPRLAGARGRGAEIASALPGNLSDATVTVDCSELMSAAQGFTDELCKQMLEVRQASSVVFTKAPDRFRNFVLLSAKNRDFASRVSFQE